MFTLHSISFFKHVIEVLDIFRPDSGLLNALGRHLRKMECFTGSIHKNPKG